MNASIRFRAASDKARSILPGLWQGLLWLVLGMASAVADEAAVCPPGASLPSFPPGGIERAAERAQDRGFLWRIERDGRSSWLYGTVHLGRAPWVFLGPALRRSLGQSDVLALELDLADSATLQAMLMPSDPQAAQRVLTPERQARLARLRIRACLPEAPQNQWRPVLQALTLSTSALRADGLHPEFGSEIMLMASARVLGKPVVALESAAAQVHALEGDSEAEQARQLDEALDQLEDGSARTTGLALVGAWARGDGAKLQDYRAWCDCVKGAEDERALQRLLDDRHPALADGIARLHAQGQRVFAAVGTLHMFGPNGLPALMAQRGFVVTQVLPAPPAQ